MALSRVWILKAFTAAGWKAAFLALFLVPRQWRPLPHWGLQEILVQLHGAVPDHRPDRGGDEVREAGLVRVLARHRVGGQLADVHRGAELEGPYQGLRHLRTGPPSRPHCPGHPLSAASACPPFPGWPSCSPCRWAPSSCHTPCTSWRPSSPRAWCNRGRSRMWVPYQWAVLQAPISQASALASLLSRGAEQGLMLILHLGDVEHLDHTLQAPLLELGALKASQELLDVLGLQSAEPGGRGRIETREVARHLSLNW